MIFGLPWWFWVLLVGYAMICIAVEDAAVAWGLMKKPEDVHPVWASLRGRLVALVVILPIMVGFLVLLG